MAVERDEDAEDQLKREYGYTDADFETMKDEREYAPADLLEWLRSKDALDDIFGR